MIMTDIEGVEPNPFHIDLLNLHTEWAKQPELYHRHAKRLTKARDALARAKSRLDVVKAELDLEIRRCPKKFNLIGEDGDPIGGRLTEAIYMSTVLLQPEYQQAQEECHKAQYAVNLHQAAVDALDHKKKSLEGEVQLHLRDYWSEPKVRRDVRDSFDDRVIARRRKEEQGE